jgi:F-type H+-transporting ATPase subunit a
MVAAIEVNINHLFFWDPVLFDGTPFEVNRVAILMIASSLLCIAFFLVGARRKALVPKGMQNITETAYSFVRNQIALDVIGPKDGLKYAPYLAALFFFIFFSNLLEIIPGINFPVTSRMAIPAVLSLLTYIIFNIIGIVKQGPIHYFKETLFPPGVPKPVYILLTPIELFSVFVIRPLTLAVRLLANMMAGHVLLTIFFLFTHYYIVENFKLITAPLGVLTFVVACVLILFEVLVISIQAYIFTMLTAFYIAEATHGHGESDVELEREAGEKLPVPEHEVEGLKPQTA